LTTAGHFKSFFVICIIRIFAMKMEKSQLRLNNWVCAGVCQLLRGRATVQLTGNIVCETFAWPTWRFWCQSECIYTLISECVGLCDYNRRCVCSHL
jgi:hypothetical protein